MHRTVCGMEQAAHLTQKTPIRALCLATGLTCAQIADELGVTPTTARALSCGRLPTSERLVRKISFLFGVELAPLFERGEAILREDGLPLTPQRWRQMRDRLAGLESTLARNLNADPAYQSPLHAELSAALRRASESGNLLSRYSDIHAFLRAV